MHMKKSLGSIPKCWHVNGPLTGHYLQKLLPSDKRKILRCSKLNYSGLESERATERERWRDEERDGEGEKRPINGRGPANEPAHIPGGGWNFELTNFQVAISSVI